MNGGGKTVFRKFLSDYGMLLVLALLAGYYSFATMNEQFPSGAEAAAQVARAAGERCKDGGAALLVTQRGGDAAAFAQAAATAIEGAGLKLAARVEGDPSDLRAALERQAKSGEKLAAIVTTREAGQWPLLRNLGAQFPPLAQAAVIAPQPHRWPDFLKKTNLLAIADRIVVIAIIAIGMTLVIITGGIDLSVGSLIALSAVLSTLLIREAAGGRAAGAGGMALCFLAAVALCGLMGLASGVMVTMFAIPPFIVTLAVMLVASGLAFILAAGQSIYEVPAAIDWLGRGASIGGIPNTVALMAALYLVAHLLMTRTVLGRYIYAVGGNAEAARLSGVPVKRVIILVYIVCSALAGVGGVVQASQLQSGAPTYGAMYELYVIAAVVVGGTSLSGGQGRILGTLIGALIIAVIQNGMNLTGVESYTQKVVLGLVILGAVLIDQFKKKGWRRG